MRKGEKKKRARTRGRRGGEEGGGIGGSYSKEQWEFRELFLQRVPEQKKKRKREVMEV